MITLYQYPPALGVGNLSAFCLKTEAWLKLSGLEYKVEHVFDPRKGPKNKAPFIGHNEDQIGDSTLIIEYLKNKFDIHVGREMTKEEEAVAKAFQTLIEEHLYWCIVFNRWIEDENWPLTKEIFFGNMPSIMKTIIPNMARKSVVSTLYHHGLGRHSREEIYYFAEKDVKAISDYLGNKRFFCGNDFTEIDLCIYATIVNMRIDDFKGPLKGLIKKYGNLNDHCDRVAEYIDFSVKQKVRAA
ncbi:glutathione S-transferase family protein [Curvivirga sp.]|uniref:glutathione S-transferase family protein n=1 Tax=Curvivirga sp. TaxID=2856848 RepID=UPI003B5B4B07